MNRVLVIADHWQALLAGILGFAAAIVAVVMTLRAERRKAAAEDRTFKHALGAEVRQFGLHAYEALELLRVYRRQAITVQQIEDAARFPSPAIYLSNGHRIGSLGDHDAQQLVYFYGQIDMLRSGIARMRRDRAPTAVVDPADIQRLSDALLEACTAAVGLLSPLSVEAIEHPNDAKFRKLVEEYKAERPARP